MELESKNEDQKDNEGIQLTNQHEKPKGLIYEDKGKKETNPIIRQRIKIVALNIGSFWAKKKAVECYINGHQVNVVIFTEANVVLSSVAKVNLPNFTCTNHCCRTQENVKGGGGGGVLIFIHHALPCLPGYDMVCEEKHEMEHCSTTIYPQYDFGLPLNIVGV